jgi:hypothetical protein
MDARQTGEASRVCLTLFNHSLRGEWFFVACIFAMKRLTYLILTLLCALDGQKLAAQAVSDFAVRVVDFAHLGGSPYNDPLAVLGKPTTWIMEIGATAPVACSLVYGAWNVAPDGTKLITTLGNSQQMGYVTGTAKT